MEVSAWPLPAADDLFDGAPFDVAPGARAPSETVGGGAGVGPVPELGGAPPSGALFFDIAPEVDLAAAKGPEDTELLFSPVSPGVDDGSDSPSDSSASWATLPPAESGLWSGPRPVSAPVSSVKAEPGFPLSPPPPPPPRHGGPFASALAPGRRAPPPASSSPYSPSVADGTAAAAAAERHAAATAVSAWTARWSANGLLLAEPEDFSAGCRRELRRRLRCVKIGRASPGVGGAGAGGAGASAGIKKEGGGGGRSRGGAAAAATARSAPLTPAQAAMLDRRQARVIRNREVALRARRAAKEKMMALVQENGDMAARAASLVAENAALKREVAALRHQLA
ncbi:hypothetical protein BU14_1337s0001 [Porphyra umbilicalis]|uniref:BZIP domain-containing protein n=1 Tax=Porphyra umbilicalis TaxID=2786 RepID=A0A1X6NM37_PORUM|nr:hypothetical protein BU14_1337s0001 [Porphyra umbilicalis]|eukprot:OSX69622.1 hypothetical protein BU14_1337s0001 [Porphyra umbilicalis]